MFFIILEAVKVRMENEISINIPQTAKLHGVDTVHKYINIETKGFSANMVCSIRQPWTPKEKISFSTMVVVYNTHV